MRKATPSAAENHRAEVSHFSANRALKIEPQPKDPDFWLTQARILEGVDRTEEAYGAFTKAINLAGQKPIRSKAYLSRANCLKRQNRLSEAAADICLVNSVPLRGPTAAPEQIDPTFHYNASLKEAWRLELTKVICPLYLVESKCWEAYHSMCAG